MNFYTLNYNCNIPTTQQINVPTNTDYKLGIKVMRNGKEQNLKPAEITIGSISADHEDINGYAVFTMSATDTESYTQETIDIRHAQDSASQLQVTHNETGASMTHSPLSAAVDSSFVGKTITPNTLKMWYTPSSDTPPVESDIALSAKSYWDIQFESDRAYISWSACEFIKGDQGSIWTFRGDATGNMYRESMKNEGKWDGSTPFFFFAKAGSNIFDAIYDYTFDGSEVFKIKDRSLPSGKYDSGYVAAVFDDPFDVKFKLNTNIYKSQQGNANPVSATGTAMLSGEYSDGTDFNFTIATK